LHAVNDEIHRNAGGLLIKAKAVVTSLRIFNDVGLRQITAQVRKFDRISLV